MNLLKLLSEFNPSKFIVYNCLLIFTMLFALRLDNTIQISWFAVFAPLFFWKSLALLGSSIAIWIWLVNPTNPNSTYRLSETSYVHFKSMLISLSLQLLMLMFELLSCDKLQNNRNQFLWVINFLPLIFISLLSIAICFWAMKNDRSFELELFCSVNIIQFIFIALRLDNLIKWNWFVVLIPLFVILSLSLIGCLYALIFFLLLLKSPEPVNIEQRKSSLYTAISYTFVILPFLIFLFLLANKLDSVYQLSYSNLHFNFVPTTSSLNNLNMQQMSYFNVFIPNYFGLIVLILLSFFGTNNNSWYFGIRKDFMDHILKACPCLESMREYANISYNKQNNSSLNQSNNNLENVDVIKNQLKTTKPKINNLPIVPQLLIDTPD